MWGRSAFTGVGFFLGGGGDGIEFSGKYTLAGPSIVYKALAAGTLVPATRKPLTGSET